MLFRSFMVSFFIAFSIFAAGSIKARILFCLDSCFRFLGLCLILDIGSIALHTYTGYAFPLVAIQVMAGFAGLGVFAVVIIRRGAMPSPVEILRGEQSQRRAFWRLGITGTVAVAASIWAAFTSVPLFDELRQVALLGGLGPGVILFLLVLFAQLYAIAIVDRLRSTGIDFIRPLTIVVPAHNEEYVIGQTIRHLDEAAVHYGGAVELIIVNDASTDATVKTAEAAIEGCRAIAGRIIHAAGRGKAGALNKGVACASHEFIVRIDADTQIGEDNLRLAMQHFADPKFGALGGVPLPPGHRIFDAGRRVEVLLKHGYYSAALAAADGLVGIPGMFVVYRAEALARAGTFAQVMNGEDTDISLRIAELGYRTFIDPRITYVSEVPTSFAHLREQRLRWFRSVYHVSARAHSLISSPSFSIRGKLVLPYMLLNTSRRAMMIPLVVFGVLELSVRRGAEALPHWQAIAAVLLGSPMLAATLAIVVNMRPLALLSLPPYVFFRALRSWYTLESALSIPITSNSTRIQIGGQPWPETPQPARWGTGDRMKRAALMAAAACATIPHPAAAQDSRVSLDGVLSYGLDVVPPDVVDTSPDQDRIRGVLDSELGVSYDAGIAVVRASAGARVFPSESDYNRYPLTIGARFDVPLSKDRRTRLRLRPSYEYVLSNDGRVFDRVRLDAQLIHRHNAANTTTFRVRYGYRNQSERRFTGYDQSEWLGELRHFWRPGGGPTRINASLLGLIADAQADRFSYNGYGTLLTARSPLGEKLEAYGRIYLVHRDYKAPFSTLYPYKRKDTQLRLTAGLERRLNDRFSLFGEAGYARNNSNVPTRRYDGFVGRVGILLRQ